jgi:hypothetical protein
MYLKEIQQQINHLCALHRFQIKLERNFLKQLN